MLENLHLLSIDVSDKGYNESIGSIVHGFEFSYDLITEPKYSYEFLIFIKKICDSLKLLSQILMFSTVAFGVLTNILCIIVFARPNFKKTTMGIFYINISVWNIIFLFFYILVMNSKDTYGINISIINDFLCAFSVFFKRVIREMPPWIEAYLTIDRYLAVCHPQKFRKIRDRKYITPICMALFLIVSIISIENLWYYVQFNVIVSQQGVSSSILGYDVIINATGNKTTNKCKTSVANSFASDYISILLRVIIPSLVMCIFSYLIVRAVIESKKNMASRKSSTVVGTDKSKNKLSRESSFTRTVVYMNLIFIFLNLPVTVIMILINFYLDDYDVLTNAIIGNVYLLTYDFSNFYYSLRFVFNLLFNRLFRDEFFLMFNIKQSSEFSSKTSKSRVVSTRGPISTNVKDIVTRHN